MAKKNKTTDLFGEDAATTTAPQSEFEALLNGSRVHVRGLATGDRFRGEVLAVSGQEAFIATGTPTDAVMPFTISAKTPAPKTGDMVDVIVVRVREGEILVKAVGSTDGGADVDNLEDAFDMELPVEGVVLEAVKGGFRVKIHGQKGFCPVSQIDWRCTNNDDYVGKKFSFIITKWERGRDLVVSRRKILEQERAVAEGDFINTAEIGAIFSGTIFRLEKYGAFIRLDDGIEGLIPISEMSWSRINHPQEVVNLEQTVQVKLLRAEEAEGRLKVSFSLKQGGSTVDPWSTVEEQFPVGTQLEGTVERKEPYGLFVSLAPGLTGLLPRSAWRDSVEGNQYETKRKGEQVKIRVERIDLDAHRLSLALPTDGDDGTWRDHTAMQGSKGSAAGLGTLGDLLKGVKLK